MNCDVSDYKVEYHEPNAWAHEPNKHIHDNRIIVPSTNTISITKNTSI